MFLRKLYFLQDEATGLADGGSAAPATTPVVESTSNAGTSFASSDGDWLDMSEPDEDAQTPQGQGSPKVTTPVTPPSVPVPATPVATAAAAPVVAPAAPVVQPTSQTQPTSPAAVDGQPVEQPAQPTTGQPTLQQLREQEVTRLQSFYALSDDDARLAITQPEAVLPKLAASLHMNVVDSVVNAVLSRVPEIVQATQQRTMASQRSESEFYQAWPTLNKPEYKQAVFNAVAAYRQLNPNAPKDEVIRAAGLHALINLRLPIPRELLQQETPAPVTTVHTPALGTSGVAHQQQSGTPNPFEVMSQEFKDWDTQP